MLPSLSVIVPAHNEAANVAPTVRAADAALKGAGIGRLDWILVDDGSTDGTRAVMRSLAESVTRARIACHETRRGLGAAIWTGVACASSEWCGWLPADGQIAPEAIAQMASAAKRADLVMLMREEGKREAGRRLLTAGMYGLSRVLLGFDPYGFSGVFLVRRHCLEGLPLRSASGVQNYAVVMHCRRKGYRIEQARTVMRPRLSGTSKVANPGTALRVLIDILRLRFGGERDER